MHFRIEIKHVSPIARLAVEINLTQHRVMCVAGRNSTGKTTLIKALRNLAQADTYFKTSSDGIFNEASSIRYTIDGEEYLFKYDAVLRSISTRELIRDHHKAIVTVEMPAPHGQRFTFFRTLAEHDDEIRQAVVLGEHKKPTALIEFLANIYQDNRFENLVEVQFRRGACCCFIGADKRYIREDYFSSGEYFLINLYRKLTQGTRLVVIDEIDISLDASTQARLAEQLRHLCELHQSTVFFTSHSLALMQTLEPNELYYLDRDGATGMAELTPMSFNEVKSLMFGFKGFDRYILTEDDVLAQFLEYTIHRYCHPTFYSYQIICLGGKGYIAGMMRRNVKYGFLGPSENVIGIRDKDRDLGSKKHNEPVHCIPLQNVEKALWDLYREDGFTHRFEGGEALDDKPLYGAFRRSQRLSPDEIFQLLCDRHNDAMLEFSKILAGFLCRPGT